MDRNSSYFFCGIGGSGMLPLACIVRARGGTVAGSDRALDQGRTSDKFDFLRARGIDLFPQDGSGITDPDQLLVTSAAVEESIPDVQGLRQMRDDPADFTDAQCFEDARLALGIGHLVDAEAQDGHPDAIVERDHLHRGITPCRRFGDAMVVPSPMRIKW